MFNKIKKADVKSAFFRDLTRRFKISRANFAALKNARNHAPKKPPRISRLLGDFKVGSGLKLNNLRSLNLYLGLRAGIDAHASLAFSNRECAESDKLKLLVLLNASLYRGENNIESFFGASLRGVLAEKFLDFKNEFCFIHICYFIGC